jgi:hypothetical protein
MDQQRKNIIKLEKLIKKNKTFIHRIVVSEEFMNVLLLNADLVKIDDKDIKSENSPDPIRTTYLWDIECVWSFGIKKGCVLEMEDGTYIVLSI